MNMHLPLLCTHPKFVRFLLQLFAVLAILVLQCHVCFDDNDE